MAVGPRARGAIDLLRPVGENIEAIAEAFGRRVNDVTTIVLDRPRHHDLIEEIRNSGARIKLIQDGDVTAAISAAIRGTNDHLAIGIGGTRQAVLSAAALRCLGGELQAQFWPTSRSEIEELREAGILDYERVFRTEDLAPGEVIVAATGVSNGDLLRGVRFLADSARTHSLAHVHALQLGAVRRRHPLLRPRAARGSAAPRLLDRTPNVRSLRHERGVASPATDRGGRDGCFRRGSGVGGQGARGRRRRRPTTTSRARSTTG